MAGIFERIGDILSSNINALLDKAEDPGKMVDQYLRKAKEDLADVRKNTAAVMAEEKRCKRLVDEAKQEVKELTAYAEKAVLAGNDGDATIFLTKKQAAAGRLADAEQTYATAKGHADQMRQAHDKLVSDISALEAFDRMADKAQAELDAAQAEAELGTRSGDGVEELKSKYDAAPSGTVADELAAMKARLHGNS